MHQASAFLWALIILLTTGAPPTSAQPPAGLPNIVLIIADDIGWNDLGCYGNPVVQTPNIDRIAGEGVRFTNAYLTTSSCSPSRVSIVSGRYPHNTGAAELHSTPPESLLTFPERLRQAGYYTAQAGKWHMGEHPRRGFDTIHDNGTENGDGGEALWVQTLEERPEDRPFFLWLAAVDAHRDWGPNEFSGDHDPARIDPPPYLADGDSTRADLARYYDEVKRFDHYIGAVETKLQEQGILDNTVMIIMSDNGRPFPRCKTRMYDSGIKTPFIVKWPAGISQNGAVSNSLLSAVDIAPTILELAGAKIPAEFQGRSFLALLKEPGTEFRQYIFAEHNWHDYEAHERMVRTKDFMYILNSRPQYPNQGPADAVRSPAFQELLALKEQGNLTAAQTDIFIAPRSREELYNCLEDPMQLVNVASLPVYQEKLYDMRQVLHQWMLDTDDSVPQQLTGDWFDRLTGEELPAEKRVRGQMPGADKKALEVKNEGGF